MSSAIIEPKCWSAPAYQPSNLNGKVAVVTGASRGIGRAIASELARAGATVAVNYSGNHVSASETSEAIIAAGGRAACYQCDIADYSQVSAMMKRIAAEFGGIDILINNAGILVRSFLMLMSTEDFRRVLDVNLIGTFHCIKAVAPIMMKRKAGTIVNVSSLAGSRGLIGQGAYAASKAAINTFTHVAAKEFSSHGIRINAIAPGCIDTGMMNEFSPSVRQEYVQQIPLRRYGAAEEVARCVYFLASDLSSYMTGQVLTVDGGMSVG
jgi:3-oxoacyl-[acyl-carrier protein] reductase